MTINETVKMYYKENKVMDIKIEYADGIRGKTHRWTEQEYDNNFGSFFDGTEKILIVGFEPYYVTHGMVACSYREKDIPSLYILYV